MKKSVCLLLIGVAILNFCGCVSRAEFDELKTRVDTLEQNNAYSNPQDINSITSDGFTEDNKSADFYSLEIANYIENYDDVVSIIQQEFNGSIQTVRDYGTKRSEDNASFKQFGNGWYLIYVNEVCVQINCENFVALNLKIYTGKNWEYVDIPSSTT